MLIEKYNLKDIEYDKWDAAFDDFNKTREHFPDLSFDTWYTQQCCWTEAAEKRKEAEIDEELTDNFYHLVKIDPILNMLADIVTEQQNRAEDLDEEDEWNPWDELYEEDDEEDNYQPF